MPNILHNVLSTTEIHEPKGVASANAGSTYVSDGSGSGDWVVSPTGWGYYADDTAEQTFTTTAAKLTNDGLGSTSNSSYLPLAIRSSSELWDTSADKIDPIKTGDLYEVRINLPVTARATAKYLTLELDIGGGTTPSNVVYTERLNVDKSAPFTVATSFSIFTLNTFVTNGGQIFLTTDAGSIGITSPRILIARTHSEIT